MAGDRAQWKIRRLEMQDRLARHELRSTLIGERPYPMRATRILESVVIWTTRLSGLHCRGRRNARALRLHERDLHFNDLPPAFDGYTVLHLSDLHVKSDPGMVAVWVDALAALTCDLAVITGDFQNRGNPPGPHVAELLAPLFQVLQPADGTLAILGNHDTAELAEALEGAGVRVLINESLNLPRGDDSLIVVGVDDVHFFHTPAATAAIAAHAEGFRILLAHTPDLAELAEQAGYSLYLTGHTHAGQIALPGGRPLATGLDRNHHLAVGFWRQGRLQGHTSPGTGSSHPPLRYNTRPEATLIRLHRV